ncbi:hypothetical protein GQ457_02G026330 [Hibiscus cannabinus]
MSPFEVVYGFNPITPLDLLPLPQEQVISKDGKARADYVKRLHQQVKENLERRAQQYERRANKGRKRVTFEVGDWVWVHFRKEHFPAQRSSKLLPRGDGPFQVVVRKTNPSQEGGDDVSTSSSAHVADPEVLPQGPVTRERTCAQGLKLSSVEAWSLYAARFSSTKLIHLSYDVSTSSSTHVADPEVLPQGPITRWKEERELGKLHLARWKLGSLYAARFSSTKLLHLQLARFSSTQLQLAQLQLY